MTKIWTRFDTLAIAALVLLLGALAAEAQVTCTTIGTFTHCTGSTGTVTCTRIGNFTHCN